MNFWQKTKAAVNRWFSGRNGPDQLSMVALWAGLLLSLADTLLRTNVLSLLGLALYVYAIFRVLSKDRTKRAAENWRFVSRMSTWGAKLRQRWIRLKNFRQYKYFHCPKCGALMRLARGSGEKSMHCPKCQETFSQKA